MKFGVKLWPGTKQQVEPDFSKYSPKEGFQMVCSLSTNMFGLFTILLGNAAFHERRDLEQRAIVRVTRWHHHERLVPRRHSRH